MGDIGPVQRHYEVLASADLPGPSFDRMAELAARLTAGSAGTVRTDPPTGSGGERDDTASG